MDVLHTFENVPPQYKGACLAIGNFDGVHLGHQAVLCAAIKQAKQHNALAAAMTFEPHPRQFFSPENKLFRLTPAAAKLSHFADLGLDFTIVPPFDKKLAELNATEFVTNILVDGLAVRHVTTGYDFSFGKGREGDGAYLSKMGQENGFGAEIIAAEGDEDTIYSSSAIRQALREGDPFKAAAMLGRWWKISGTVQGGEKRGHDLGFPTANIALSEGQAPKEGIYAARVVIDGRIFNAAGYIGRAPTFDHANAHQPVLEVFLFDFAQDIYGKTLDVELIEYVRPDKRFDDADALKAQMTEDCKTIEEILRNLENNDPFASREDGRRHSKYPLSCP